MATAGMAGCAGGGTATDAPESPVSSPTADPIPTASSTPTKTAEPVPRDRGPLPPRIRDHGHYAWFALSEETWGRQATPFDMSDGSSRWLAQPTDDGGIRILVKDIDYFPYFYQNVGFDIRLGRLGDIGKIRIRSEAVQSGQLDPQLFIGLLLDEDDDGEFFAWKELDGDRDAWVGMNGDEEAVIPTVSKVGEPLVMEDDTKLEFVNRGAHQRATFGQLKQGEIDVIDGGGRDNETERETGTFRGIDADTNAAIYVGLADNGDGSAVEALIQSVLVERSRG